MYRNYQAACDAEIEHLVVRFEPRLGPAEQLLPPDGNRSSVAGKAKP